MSSTNTELATSPHFDLTSMLNLQKSYAVDLTKIPIDTATNTNNSNAIANLNTQLAGLQTNLQGSQADASSVVYKQKLINNILDNESNRLKQKKENIDVAMSGQRRMIALNNNYQKRYAAFTKMTIAFTVGVVIYIFMDKLMVLMPFIPQFVFYIIIIVVLGAVIIYIYVMWTDIQRREKTNFDELALPAPDLSGTPNAAAGPSSAGGADGSGGATGTDGTKDYSKCTNSACCGNGLSWSDSKGCYAPSIFPS